MRPTILCADYFSVEEANNNNNEHVRHSVCEFGNTYTHIKLRFSFDANRVVSARQINRRTCLTVLQSQMRSASSMQPETINIYTFGRAYFALFSENKYPIFGSDHRISYRVCWHIKSHRIGRGEQSQWRKRLKRQLKCWNHYTDLLSRVWHSLESLKWAERRAETFATEDLMRAHMRFRIHRTKANRISNFFFSIFRPQLPDAGSLWSRLCSINSLICDKRACLHSLIFRHSPLMRTPHTHTPKNVINEFLTT